MDFRFGQESSSSQEPFLRVLKLVLLDTNNVLDASASLKHHRDVLTLFLRACHRADSETHHGLSGLTLEGVGLDSSEPSHIPQ